jgi:hypothetical protein
LHLSHIAELVFLVLDSVDVDCCFFAGAFRSCRQLLKQHSMQANPRMGNFDSHFYLFFDYSWRYIIFGLIGDI